MSVLCLCMLLFRVYDDCLQMDTSMYKIQSIRASKRWQTKRRRGQATDNYKPCTLVQMYTWTLCSCNTKNSPSPAFMFYVRAAADEPPLPDCHICIAYIWPPCTLFSFCANCKSQNDVTKWIDSRLPAKCRLWKRESVLYTLRFSRKYFVSWKRERWV